MLDALGEPALIRAVSLDITALKEAEAEREGTHSMLQATLDATADAILVVDLEGHITACNSAFRISGRSRRPCSMPATTPLSSPRRSTA